MNYASNSHCRKELSLVDSGTALVVAATFIVGGFHCLELDGAIFSISSETRSASSYMILRGCFLSSRIKTNNIYD